MSGFNRGVAVFYTLLVLYRAYLIFLYKPSWMRVFERMAYGDAGDVIARQAGTLSLPALALVALFISLLIIALAFQNQDLRTWMSLSIVIGIVWIIAFVMRGMPPPYDPLLWLMGVAYRISTVILASFLLGVEIVFRSVAKHHVQDTSAPLGRG